MTQNNHDEPRLRMGPDPEEEALFWIARMTSGHASDTDRRRFEIWRAVPENAAFYAELEHVWAGIGEALQTPDNVVELRPRVRRFEGWGRRVAAVAACVTLMGLAGYQYETVWQYDQVTQGAARGHAELADGSRIELNTGSALKIDYSGKDRRVTLARGEAFFDVKHDETRPFVIKAGDGEVRVLGTAFSVKREGDGARVTVIRGKVRVSAGDTFVDVVPNQQVAFDGGAPGAIAQVDATSELAWSTGHLILRNRPLGEVLAQVDRYYSGSIVLENEKAAKRRVNAVVDLDHIDDWLASVSKSQGVKATRSFGTVYLR